MFRVFAAAFEDVPRQGNNEDDFCSPHKGQHLFHIVQAIFKSRGGGQAEDPHRGGIAHPRPIFQREWAGHLRPYLGRRNSSSGQLQPCQFPSVSIFQESRTVCHLLLTFLALEKRSQVNG
jgi:hypothetical protein